MLRLTYNPNYVHAFPKSYLDNMLQWNDGTIVKQSTLGKLWGEDLDNLRRFGLRFCQEKDHPGVALDILTENELRCSTTQRLGDLEVPTNVEMLHSFVEVSSDFRVDPKFYIVVGQVADAVWYVDTKDIVKVLQTRTLERITDTSTNEEVAQFMSESFEFQEQHQRLLGYIDSLFGRFRDNLSLDDTK